MNLGNYKNVYLIIQALLVIILVFLSLFKVFVNTYFINIFAEAYLFFIVILFIPFVKGFIKYISIILFITGSFILIINDSGLEVWFSSISINHMLVSLFVATPLLGAPFQSQSFMDALEGLYIKFLYKPTMFSIVTQLLTHVTAIVLNIGSISIFLHLSTSNPYVKSNRIISAALIRGLAGSIIWSPFFAAMALILSQLPIEWKTIFPFLLGYIILFFIISIIIEYLYIRTQFIEIEDSSKEQENIKNPREVNWKKILEFIFLIIVIIMIVFVLKSITSFPIVSVIVITAYLYPVFYFVLKKQFLEMREAGKYYIQKTLSEKRKEIVLFLLIGFFGGAIAETSFGIWFSGILVNTFGEFILGISLVIALSMIIISSVGFHPVMIATIYTTSIDPSMLNMSMNYFAILLLGSWGISTISSPMTAVNFLVSNYLNEKLITTSFKWNILFILFSLIALLIYLAILESMDFI